MTTILQVIGKPALVNWAANVERTAVVEAAANLYEDAPATPKMTRPTYITTLMDRLGKQKAHQKQVERAADLGSQVHKLAEWNLRNELGQKQPPAPKLERDAEAAFAQYEAWRGSVTLVPKMMEQMVWHPGERYAGTLDVLCDLDGIPTILDFKTSKALYFEHEVQVAAYAYALSAMGHGMVQQAVIVKLPKQAGQRFETRELDISTLADRFDAFMEAFRLWKHVNLWNEAHPWNKEAAA